MIKRLLLAVFISCAPLVLPAVALAQTGSATATKANTVPEGFQRVAGAPETEKVDANKLVVGAYVIFFVCMFGYVVYVARSQSAIAKEMAELAERIRRAEKRSP